jgi:outer membrane protein
MKRYLKLMIPALVLSMGFAYADTSAMKIAVVDVQQVIHNAPDTAKFEKALEQQFKPRQENLRQQSQALETQRQQFMRNAATMSDKDKQAEEQKLMEATQALQQQMQQYQQDLDVARQKDMQSLIAKVQTAIDQVAKQEKLNLVVVKQAAPYSDGSLDITKEVQKALNAG